MTLEEEYKQETGKNVLMYSDSEFYPKTFIEWLKSKYEQEHARRVAAEKYIDELNLASRVKQQDGKK